MQMTEERVKEHTDRWRESTHCEQQNKKIGGNEEQKGKKETYGAMLTQPSIRVLCSCHANPKKRSEEKQEGAWYGGGRLTPQAP